jgi:hypothetical protein
MKRTVASRRGRTYLALREMPPPMKVEAGYGSDNSGSVRTMATTDASRGAKGNLKLVPPAPKLRILLRRSEKEGQEFSIDTQREGALRFAEGLRRREPPVRWEGVKDYVDDGIAGDDFAGRVAPAAAPHRCRAG